MAIGDRIKEVRVKAGMRQEDLGKLLGVGKSAVNNYERHSRHINSALIIELIRIFNVDANFFFQDYDLKGMNLSGNEIQMIKDYNELDEYGRKNVDDLISNEINRVKQNPDDRKMIFRDFYFDLNDFYNGDNSNTLHYALRDTAENNEVSAVVEMNDDSLSPLYEKGDILLLKRCDSIPLNEYGLFKVKKRFFFRRMEAKTLVALNPEYKDIAIDDHVRCLALIVNKIDAK